MTIVLPLLLNTAKPIHVNVAILNITAYQAFFFNLFRYIATTFFAAAYARMILPCYDEPNQKAKFKINVIHNPKYHALSNMPIKSKSEPL
jgi:aminopeptidase N